MHVLGNDGVPVWSATVVGAGGQGVQLQLQCIARIQGKDEEGETPWCFSTSIPGDVVQC